MNITKAIVDQAVWLLASLIFIESIICMLLLRKSRQLKGRLDIAIQAAEDAARAAALAAPGGIDPEAVIALLRTGQPTSLDAVYAVMERQGFRTPQEK